MILLHWLLACADPTEPRAVAWDREVCDECGMTVSDPAFAVQLVEGDGDVHLFDDPACAFRYIVDEAPEIRFLWFRDSTGDGWLDWREVRFTPADGAPMDGGLAAVPLGTPDTLSFGEASGRALGGAR